MSLTNAEFAVLREAVDRDGVEPFGEGMTQTAAGLAERGLLRRAKVMYYPTEQGKRAFWNEYPGAGKNY